MSLLEQPLVTCIMPTYNRCEFVPRAIEYFLRQDYPSKELIIVDDGEQPVGELVPETGNIRYIRLKDKANIGAKRNLACDVARGNYVAHWDDDDWYSVSRISNQVLALEKSTAELTGVATPLYYNTNTGRAYQYTQGGAKRWLQFLFYRRSFWLRHPHPEIPVGSDTRLLYSMDPGNTLASANISIGVCMIHGRNVSPKKTTGWLWRPIETGEIRDIVGEDWSYYESGIMRSFRPELNRDTEPRIRVRSPHWIVVITTYERPDHLENLLLDLVREKGHGEIEVRVYDDASSAGYEKIERILIHNGWKYRRFDHNHGKKRFHALMTHIFQEMEEKDPENANYIVLQDDFRLCRGFFSRVQATWESIKDTEKIALYLVVEDSRTTGPCWTGFVPRDCGSVEKTQWIDGVYLAPKRLFKMLDYRVPEVASSRWQTNRELSSGVGQHISRSLHNKGLGMYRVKRSLAVHVAGASLMNGELRAREPLTTVSYIDGERERRRLARGELVVARLATQPARRSTLERTVASLISQVDRLCIYLNEYGEVPHFLEDSRIVCILGAEHGDLGDRGKFWEIDQPPGYRLTIDDDIIYPEDYVQTLIEAVDRYQKRAVVGFHGVKIKPRPRSYYRDREVFHFATRLDKDTGVHLLGTGCAAWHSATLDPRLDDFETSSMADIWLAIKCQREKVPMVCLKHGAGWLEDQPVTNSIYEQFKRQDQLQTETVNRIDNWIVNVPSFKEE